MSRPIKDTPILRGKEAAEFWAMAERNVRDNVKVPKAEYERAMKAYRSIRFVPPV